MTAGPSDLSPHSQPGPTYDLLRIDQVPVGAHGVPGLYWPVGLGELQQVRDEMLAGIAPLLRNALVETKPMAAELAAVSPYLVLEALALFEARALLRRLGRRRVGFPPPSGRLLEPLARGSTPAAGPLISELLRAHPSAPKWRLAARAIRGSLRGDGFSHAPVTPTRSSDEIIATTAAELERFHAARTDGRITLARYETWFPPLGPRETIPLDTRRFPTRQFASLAMEFMYVVESAFKVSGEKLDPSVHDYLAQYLAESSEIVSAFMHRARERISLIPRRLWTGTGGNIWGRMLRILVQENDGHVTAHDHATGSGHFGNDLRAFYEYPFCDDYIVFNEVQASASRDHLRSDLLLTRGPRIRPVDGASTEDDESERRRGYSPSENWPSTINRIMYVGPFYIAGRQHLYPWLSYQVLVDWEARLLTTLHDAGFGISLKPHPESAYPVHPYLRRLGHVFDGRFEDVLEAADAYIFNSPTSTAFATALRTARPIILVDTRPDFWAPEARTLIERRCAIVTPEFNERGRIQVPEPLLLEAVRVAHTLRDHTFADTYLTVRTSTQQAAD